VQFVQDPGDHDAVRHDQDAAEDGCIQVVEEELLRHFLLHHDLLGDARQDALQRDVYPFVQLVVGLREDQAGDENQ